MNTERTCVQCEGKLTRSSKHINYHSSCYQKLCRYRQRLHKEFCKIQCKFSNGEMFRSMTRREAHYRLHELDDILREINDSIVKGEYMPFRN